MSSKIDQQLFSAHEHALEHQVCPKCQTEQREGELQLRHGKHGPFLGCSLYPECDYIKPLHQNDGHIIKELGVPCPQCSNELVLRQGRYGMFIGCSHYPECHHIESLEQNEPQQNDQVTCPECRNGHLVERKTRFGKLFYACDNYPKCKFAVNQPPVMGECAICRYPLLVEKTLASGTKYQCADRKCNHIQSE
ncbi:topoisomerase DNA-binding C4 zinc finger domain-containing protein [Vibrio kasasachensis]|uniref:DNA topoisomerase family protein n=1 Tax=Vibrio kasasachensis TaxID=2910248 RepID=UPI003D11348E